MTINDQRRRRPQKILDVTAANLWFCDRCKKYGDAIFGPDVTLQDAVQKIRAAHVQASPTCTGGTAYIALVNLEKLKAKGLVA